MATSAATLIQRTRRFVRDWPEFDTTAASLSASVTTVSIADSSTYAPNWVIQIEQEAMLVKALASATTLTVRRGIMGTTAVSHATTQTILARPKFLDVEYLDALNGALDSSFPLLYRPVSSEYTGVEADVYEYDVPTMSGISVPIPYLYELSYQETTDLPFQKIRSWSVIRSESPTIKLHNLLPSGGILRIQGFGPFTPLTALTSLDTYFPVNAEKALMIGAAETLLASGEAGRVRVDTGPVDSRENANRTGASMSAANALLSRFERELARSAMAPMPRHVKATF